MISLLSIYLFQSKRKWVFGLACIILMIMLVLLLDPFYDVNEEILYHETYQFMYKDLLLKIITLMMPFIVIMMVMDHDQLSVKPLLSFFSRYRIYFAKIMIYYFIIFSMYLFLGFYVHIIFWFIKPHLFVSLMYQDFIYLFLDGLIVCMLVLYIARDKYKAFTIVLGIFYLIIQFIQEDRSLLFLYYIFPIKNTVFDAFTLAIPYKLCYISLGLILTYQKMLVDEIYLT
jgi:hypothetical protein